MDHLSSDPLSTEVLIDMYAVKIQWHAIGRNPCVIDECSDLLTGHSRRNRFREISAVAQGYRCYAQDRIRLGVFIPCVHGYLVGAAGAAGAGELVCVWVVGAV